MTVSHHLTDFCEVSAITRGPVRVYASAHCPVCMCAWFKKKFGRPHSERVPSSS